DHGCERVGGCGRRLTSPFFALRSSLFILCICLVEKKTKYEERRAKSEERRAKSENGLMLSLYRTLSLRYLSRRWFRAALVVASIMLGVATLVATQALSETMSKATLAAG